MTRVGLSLAVLLCACVTLPLPYTASQLSVDSVRWPDKALAHYLGQDVADPSVCDLNSEGDHLGLVNDATFGSLLDAMLEGTVGAERGAQCLTGLLGSTDQGVANAGLASIAGATRTLVNVSSPDMVQLAALPALVTVISNRPARLTLAPRTRDQLLDALTDGAARGPEDPRAATLNTLTESLEMETGRLRGQAITEAMLQGITDEGVLSRMTLRLASEPLRLLARRRLLTLRASRSQYAEVRDQAAAVAERVISTGHNAVNLQQQPVLNSQFRPAQLNGVLVRQHPFERSVTLFGYDPASTNASFQIGALQLPGALFFNVKDQPLSIGICPAVEVNDPSPCIDAALLSTSVNFARLDLGGALHFTENLAIENLLTFSAEPELPIVINAAGQPIAQIKLPLWFEVPDDVVFSGSPGPDLNVNVSRVGMRLHYTVLAQNQAPIDVVIEPGEVSRFAVISRGSRGATGSAGVAGLRGPPGLPGSPAMCPSTRGGNGGRGGKGGPGGRGGPGGPGADGGNILVRLSGVQQTEVVSQIRSEGGRGGEGGAGGKAGEGGPGGSGGSSQSCPSGSGGYLSGGSSGSKGEDGVVGPKGVTGPAGRPGLVTFAPGR